MREEDPPQRFAAQLRLVEACRIGNLGGIKRALRAGADANKCFVLGHRRGRSPYPLPLAAGSSWGDARALDCCVALIEAGAVVTASAVAWANRTGNAKTRDRLLTERTLTRSKKRHPESAAASEPPLTAIEAPLVPHDEPTPSSRGHAPANDNDDQRALKDDELKNPSVPCKDTSQKQRPRHGWIALGRTLGRQLFLAIRNGEDSSKLDLIIGKLDNVSDVTRISALTWYDGNRWTALHAAAAVGAVDVCRRLLVLGASVSWRTAQGTDVLGIACGAGQVKVVALLSKFVANPEAFWPKPPVKEVLKGNALIAGTATFSGELATSLPPPPPLTTRDDGTCLDVSGNFSFSEANNVAPLPTFESAASARETIAQSSDFTAAPPASESIASVSPMGPPTLESNASTPPVIVDIQPPPTFESFASGDEVAPPTLESFASVAGAASPTCESCSSVADTAAPTFEILTSDPATTPPANNNATPSICSSLAKAPATVPHIDDATVSTGFANIASAPSSEATVTWYDKDRGLGQSNQAQSCKKVFKGKATTKCASYKAANCLKMKTSRPMASTSDLSAHLFRVCEQRDVRGITSLLKRGASATSMRSRDGASPLHVVLSHSSADVATTARDTHCSESQRAQCVQLLLDADIAAASTFDRHGYPPLFFAVRSGSLTLTQLLLNANPEISGHAAPKSGTTAMHIAAAGGFAHLVGPLSQAGAPLDAVVKNGPSPLAAAARHGQLDVALALLARGASPRRERGNESALKISLERRQYDIASVLIDAGVPLGYKIIDLARLSGSRAVMTRVERRIEEQRTKRLEVERARNLEAEHHRRELMMGS